ncbi:MAG: VOC family protein [Verrucomicrobiota bacterium]
MNLQQITPFMHVPDMGRALAFFELLGFETLYREANYAYVAREKAAIRVLENEGSGGGLPGNRRYAYYVDVRDVDALYRELQEKLETLPKGDVCGPFDQEYRMRELTIVAPDGNLLVFGQAIQGATNADKESRP